VASLKLGTPFVSNAEDDGICAGHRIGGCFPGEEPFADRQLRRLVRRVQGERKRISRYVAIGDGWSPPPWHRYDDLVRHGCQDRRMFTSLTTTVKLLVSLSGGVPLSVTSIVMR